MYRDLHLRMNALSKSTPGSILIWLTFTTRSAPCGRKVVTRRLVEWDPGSKKLLYIWPPEYRRAVPQESHLQERNYLRPHQIDPNPLGDNEFIDAATAIGIIPPGVKIT